MSKSDPDGHDTSSFDEWVAEEFHRSRGFTALVVLMKFDNMTVLPLRSTFMHIVGTEISWSQLSALLSSSGVHWDAVLFDTLTADDGGPVEDYAARLALRTLEKRVVEDRLVINEGHFFDQWGRRMIIEEMQPQ